MTQNNPERVDAAGGAASGPLVARGGLEYRLRWGAMALLFLGFGAWTSYDGFYLYPKTNAADIAKGQNPKHGPPHASLDIPFNRACGVGLPLVALATFGWMLYNSRGEYRLENGVLKAPGHPPIPLEAIVQMDKEKWDKKGIAYVGYELGAVRGTVKLDDFVYQREPMDGIYGRITEIIVKRADTKS